MPRVAKELTAIEVKRLSAPGYHAVGKVAGLTLQVTVKGSRSWLLRVTVGGKRREIGLGAYPAVGLADAHKKAQETRNEIIAGTDPVAKRAENRQALKAQQREEKRTAWTFRRCAETYIDMHKTGWRNRKHEQQWKNTLEVYAYPVIGDMRVRDVETEHVMEIVEPHWATKNETINRVRNRIELILDWAAVRGYRTQSNPARWKGWLDKMLPAPSSVAPVENHKALHANQLYEFMHRLKAMHGMGARCLEFVVLTACRSGAARLATWQEIDLDARVWNIPPAPGRKTKRPHRVPLSAHAIALLKSLPRSDDSALIFPGRSGALSDMALTAVMRRLGVDAVPHGFRSTFSSWTASSTTYPYEVREMALAHTVGSDTERAYQRNDLFAKRRHLMTDWAEFIHSSPIGGNNTENDNTVPIHTN